MNEFYANTTKCGFAVYDQNGTQTSARVDGKTSLDYVVGLVAKSIIEASQYYSQFTWAQSFAKPWFLSIQNYGNKFYSGVATSGGSLDDLNAVKLYLPLRELTKSGGTFEDNTTYSNTATALNKAITGLKAHNSSYSIKSGTLAETAGNTVTGGWWHKKDYQNQMWLDGAYMGPALFAELVNYSGKTTNIDSSNDWDLIVKQFTILRNMCWNENDKLPYHAFAADGGTNSTSHSDTWAGLSSKSPYCFHSASYWGRAVGWYFLALVDILEQMDKANLSSSTGYTTLKSYLAETAEGLSARQDKTTGGWYQILNEDGSYSASSYNGKSYTKTNNYIESSATALFTAAYLKAIRLGYLAENDYKTVAVNGYKCLVNQFFSVDDNGNVNIFGSCRSAGLGGSGDNYKAGKDRFRDGSKPYYLLGYDVARVDKSEKITEGKVLGVFILAATEYERQYQSPMLLSNDLNSTYTLSSNESLSAEVLGEGNAAYQWYDATTSTAITGATNASYTPTKSGKYYCVITVTPTSAAAKTRAASTEPYTITTSTADVTVSEVTPPSESANAVVWTFTNSTLTSGTLGKENNEVKFTSTDGSSTVMTYVSGSSDAIVSSSKTINDVTYSSYLKENGTGSVDGKRRMEFNAPSSKGTLTIVYAGTAGTTKVIDRSNGNKELATLTGEKNTAVTTDVLTTTVGNKIIIYCPIKSYIYSVIWTPINEPTGPSISISTQPASADYVTGATVKPLTVVATLDGYTLSYQWYKNTTNSNTGGTVISGATTDRYTPTLSSTAGTTYYYCVVTATKDGSETLTATSDVAAITVSEPYIKFTTQPKSGSYAINVAPSALTVVAATNLGVDITYQWYSNSSATTEGATQITDATSSSYTPSTSTVGTTYYYCIATAKKDGTTVTATSNIVSVTVATAIYSYKVKSGDTAPGINTSKYITDDSKNKLVKMTFGGWKWGTNPDQNNHTYTMPNKDKPLTDSWSAATTEGVDKLEGYDYWFEGTQDAVDESKALTGTIYGTPRYGWFVSPTRDASGKTTASHPYTLPVRGSFMTFEPTQNGTLSIYILQNGAWNTNKSGTYKDPDGEGTITFSKGQIVAGEFRPHAFHVVNQRGLTVQEFSPNYSVDTKQTVNGDYYCMFKGDKGFDQTKYDDPHNVARWKEFAEYMSPAEQKRCHDNWNNGEGGTQTIIELDNGSFLAIEKGIAKYTFHVTGNETYYFFSNFSKMGFAGASFLPDESQPQEKVEGKTSTLELSDVTAYNKITATEKGTIEGTTLKDYTYKIGETEIAPVAGVSIPQFYSIKLNRTFKPNQWTTLTLPFNLTEEEVQSIFGAGTQLIQLNKGTINGNAARLEFIYHEIQNVLPGHPYLIKPTGVEVDETNDATASVDKDGDGNITAFTVYSKCVNPFISQVDIDCGAYTFKGTPGYCTADKTNNNNVPGYSVNYVENDIFISEGNGKLYVSGGSSYGKGYRAWIAKDASASAAKISSISLVIDNPGDDDDNETTTIDMADVDPDALNALGVATGVYNLNGQKVSDDMHNLPKGIYIVNGKKIIRK
ncbi:glycoside hydrolase family 88 protein [Prevotella pectinovora]|uniref:glycoside hydrolase family 88 protein n=1 Tax=Prevotella pectinovora TaxID=1602169 RepID=UPI000697B274|nr:glycoside hydrolase family 88 protein [Prevotella pectinovora]